MNKIVKKLLYQIPLLLLIAIIVSSCSSEDELSKAEEPKLRIVLESLQLDLSSDAIPSLLVTEFNIVGVYINYSQRPLRNEEITDYINFSISTADDVIMTQDQNNPKLLTFSGQGSIALKIEYNKPDPKGNRIISATLEKNLKITHPKLVSIAVAAQGMAGSCSQVRRTDGVLVKGCLEEFEAVGTYDNNLTKDITYDPQLTWSVSDKAVGNIAVNSSYLNSYSAISTLLDDTNVDN